MTASPKAPYQLSTSSRISDIGRERWNALASSAPPFLHYEWLDALECTGCVGASRGWLPLHIAIHQGSELVGVAPAYLKGHSQGEFVFDHSFAGFAEQRLGIDYYPKLIIAVPFTPATGPRLLIRPGADRWEVTRAFANGLLQLTDKLNVSGAHILFPSPAQAGDLQRTGFLHRVGVQFHWRNPGYTGFSDFLERFNAKRRHQIRRERRELQAQSVTLSIVSGSDLTPEVVDHLFSFYGSTVDKFYWGRRYLTRHFFEEVAARMPERLHAVLARDESQRPIAGALNLLGDTALYGRYWGASEERRFLHFNVCFYAGIEDCIARGLQVFEPGAGGEHKLARGFEPTLTHSLHAFRDSRLELVVRDFVERERTALEQFVETTSRESGLKPLLGASG